MDHRLEDRASHCNYSPAGNYFARPLLLYNNNDGLNINEFFGDSFPDPSMDLVCLTIGVGFH